MRTTESQGTSPSQRLVKRAGRACRRVEPVSAEPNLTVHLVTPQVTVVTRGSTFTGFLFGCWLLAAARSSIEVTHDQVRLPTFTAA